MSHRLTIELGSLARCAGLCVVLLAAAERVEAVPITLDASLRGSYIATGFNPGGGSSSGGYLAGDCRGVLCGSSADDFRNFFQFDLTGVMSAVSSARLLLDVRFESSTFPSLLGYGSTSGASETYTVWDLSPSQIPNLGTNSVAIWGDLGSGTSLGAYAATSADIGTTIAISLNGAGVAAINAALGGQFALGGSITTLNGVADDEYLFAYGSGSPRTRLELTAGGTSEPSPVPEPASLVLACTGVAALAVRRLVSGRRTRTARRDDT